MTDTRWQILTMAPVVDTFRKRASAKQCHEHRWLVRKPQPPTSNGKQASRININPATKTPTKAPEPVASTSTGLELDVTKDNLRLFVERWREHPDSPYTIENGPLDRQSSQETVSLRGQSPSPCGSICSSSSTTDSQSPDGSGFLLSVPDLALALERRASEGRNTNKGKIDPASQILLAEEIIRLSEHLRSISIAPAKPVKVEDSTKPKKSSTVEKTNGKARTRGSVSKEAENDVNEISEKLSNIARQRKMNGTTFNGSRNLDKYNSTNDGNASANFFTLKRSSKISSNTAGTSTTSTTTISSSSSSGINKTTTVSNGSVKTTETREMDLSPPWRQARVKRRFGETCRDVPRIATLQDLHKTMNLDEPTSTKNLLLKLIDEWGELKRPGGVGGRKSISVDWCGEESVARKSINSLAKYFQSEQQKVTTAPTTSHTTSIHR